jgi:tetratricopeptide (TPR) repeat protein
LIQQVFLLSEKESEFLGVEYVLRMHEHLAQDDELIRVLNSLLVESEQQSTINMQTTIKQLLQYIEKPLNDGYQQETYRIVHRYEEALADFDRAIALDEKHAWIIGNREQAYQAMSCYNEALDEEEDDDDYLHP